MDTIVDGLNLLAFLVLPLMLVTVLLSLRRRMAKEHVAILALHNPSPSSDEKSAPPAYVQVTKTQVVDGKKVQYETVSTQSQE